MIDQQVSTMYPVCFVNDLPGVYSIHYVWLFAWGYDLAEMADWCEVDTRTVVTWLERFWEGRMAALADRPIAGGRAP